MRRNVPWPAVLGAIAIANFACSSVPQPSASASVPPTTGSIVDGFPVGPAIEANPAEVALATQALDHRDPGHAAIISVDVYLEQGYLNRSGSFSVYVFRLADGSYRATGVHCHPGGCDEYEHYP